MLTRNQLRAQRAYEKVFSHEQDSDEDKKKYKSFATSFPALIHQCGLAQAIAYAQSKAPVVYKSDLAYVLDEDNISEFSEKVRSSVLPVYQQYSRSALSASSWLKRYAEACLKDESKKEHADV